MANAATTTTPLEVLVRHLHALPEHQALLCQLLCTSADTAATIRRHCLGKLTARFSAYSMEALRAFLPWLSNNGCLLSRLSLHLNLSNSCISEAEQLVGTALQQAASSAAAAMRANGQWCAPPGLQTFSCHPAIAPALDQLDSWYLTRLELGRHAPYSCSFALEQLTRLSHLTLFEDSADVLLPSLAGLTCLTRLELVDVAAGSISKLKWVPPQVLELQLSLARLKKSEELPAGLNLAHVTALRKLTNGDGKPLLIQAGDSLPPSLQVLAVRDVLDVGPLLQLPALTHLSMCASTTPAEQLSLLGSKGGSSSSSGGSGSKGLRSVSLCYGDMQAAAAAAAGWPSLPLDRLELRAAEGRLPAHTLEMLGRLPRLRKLEIYGGGCTGFAEAAVFEASQRQLAGAVKNMTRLEVLGLRGFGLLPDAPDTPPPTTANGQQQPAAVVRAGSDMLSDCCSAEDALCAHTNNLSLSSSYDSSGDPSDHCNNTSSGSSDSSSGCCRAGSLQPLLEAVASLPALGCLTVTSVSCGGEVLAVDEAAAAAMAAATRLTCLQLSDTQLCDAAVNALVTQGGLTRLRRLAVDNNPKVTAEVLPDEVAGMLTGLRELGVLRTGIRASAAGFKARMLRVHPTLQVKSSARG